MLKGKLSNKTIYLREIKISDINQNYLQWMNNPQVTKYIESRFQKWTIKNLKDYVKNINENEKFLFLGIILKKGDKHIGNIKLGPIDKLHKSSEMGIIIGEQSFWGKNIATKAIKLLVNYSFYKLNIHKITAGAYADNIGSIKAFQKAGFLIEGVRKKQCLLEGKYADIILLGIISEE